MTFEAQTRKNKLLADIAQIDEALAKGDSVLTDTYNKIKSEKEIEIVLIDKMLIGVTQERTAKAVNNATISAPVPLYNPTTLDKLEEISTGKETPCNICGKICKSNAGLVVHQKKCKVDNAIT